MQNIRLEKSLGFAGIVAIVMRVYEGLAGVAIATAILPPVAVIGIGLGIREFQII